MYYNVLLSFKVTVYYCLQVVSKNPQEGRAVEGRQNEIAALWEKLKVKANERKTTLDHAHQLQTFLADSRDLVSPHPIHFIYPHISHTLTFHSSSGLKRQ